MTSLKYLLKSTWRTFTGNRLMNLVSVSSIALALMIMGGLLLLQLNTSNLLNQLKSQTSVIVYLNEDVSDSERQNLESRLIAQPAIGGVDFRSKQDAMRIMEDRLGKETIQGLSANPFPPSFHLSLKPDQLSSIDEVASTIAGWSGISDVDYGKEHVDRLRNISRVVEILLGSIGLIICVVAIFVIFNTIQLTVMSREDEIDILKLVGATRTFISFPFVLGGALQGMIGFLLGSATLWLLYWVVAARVRALEFFPLDPVFIGLWRGGMLLALGFLIGVIGSATAVTRTVRRM